MTHVDIGAAPRPSHEDWRCVEMTEEHEAWVRDTFRRTLIDQGRRPPMRDFDLRRRAPGVKARVAVLRDDPRRFLSWAICAPAVREIVWAYTKSRYRRLFGLAGSLVLSAGIDPLDGPIVLRYWSRAASAIARQGGPWRLVRPAE